MSNQPFSGWTSEQSLAAAAARDRARMAELEELSEYCQRALIDLVSAGTKIAKVVADRAEYDAVVDMTGGEDAARFKGGVPAARAYALASQSVRRSILLLQKVLHVAWWEDFTPARPWRSEAAAGEPAGEGAAAAEAGRDERGPDEGGEAVERPDGLDRVERPDALSPGALDPEGLGPEGRPERIRGIIAGLQQDVATSVVMARKIWPRLRAEDVLPDTPEDDENDGEEDADEADEDWRDPPD